MRSQAQNLHVHKLIMILENIQLNYKQEEN